MQNAQGLQDTVRFPADQSVLHMTDVKPTVQLALLTFMPWHYHDT